MAPSSWVLIGDGSLLAGCGEILLREGQRIAAVVTGETAIERWAAEKGIRIERTESDITALLGELDFDHLASIAHLAVIPNEALQLVRGLAVNFHDGPLPHLAGLNVTSWAILRGEKTHGITWHEMTEQVDAGRILEQRVFEVTPDETAFLLNAKCYAAGLDSFAALVRRTARADFSGSEQNLVARTYFGRTARPAAAAVIDWKSSGEEISALVRALDFGPHPNPMCVAKMLVNDALVPVSKVTVADSGSRENPGTVVAVERDGLRVATRSVDIILQGFTDFDGTAVPIADFVRQYGLAAGVKLPQLDPDLSSRLTELQAHAARFESKWRVALRSLSFPDLDLPTASTVAATSAQSPIDPGVFECFPREGRLDALLASIAVLAARRSGASTFDLNYCDADLLARAGGTHGAFVPTLPLRLSLDRHAPFAAAVAAVNAARNEAARRGPIPADLWMRDPSMQTPSRNAEFHDATVSVGLGVDAPPAKVRFNVSTDGSQCVVISDASVAPQLTAQLMAIVNNAVEFPDRPIAELDLMTRDEQAAALRKWNDTARAVPEKCIHEVITAQARLTPDATALVFRGHRMTFAELDQRTNRLARHLRALGVDRGALVGIFLQRSFAMVEAVLATLKAGGAYVPLDPTYPADRLEFMAEDAKLRLIVSDRTLKSRIPSSSAVVVDVDRDDDLIARLSSDPLEEVASPSDLAYVIYTSGSTGRPKGVMVEHRNVTNFAVGMDEQIDTTGGDRTWLAVTSLSFDISVLELLWTLSRGFRVVLHRDEDRESFVAASTPQVPVDFSLFYFSSDESERSQDKYRLLLEGARFADRNGFVAVWTPERHFHAFGGLFPNPAVTSAAVAAITERVGIRAGSVVSPLHPVLRIAEEWSVVDNISNGRVAISFAPGWQPNDFVLRPEAFANRKDLMFEQIEQVRRLWRGEAIGFPNASGQNVEVKILPRPVQKELPIWLTIAGNPESFVAAGRIGANVLTHLLGQTVQEVADKVALYRSAWREAGHAGEGTVTLMVHSLVGESDEAVKEMVREPMKAYLRSAVGLVRDAAWSFPTIKQKAMNARGEFTPDSLAPEEMDALLDYAFERYYSTSGLFGSPTTARRFVEGVRAIGVNELACLIDFGVPTETVLAHLPRLAEIVQVFKEDGGAVQRFERTEPETIPSLIERYDVTHFQCTPTMAQILLEDPPARRMFGRLRQMLVGGEALPEHLARDLASTVGGVVTNVYGPTETTVWSSTSRVNRDGSDVTIGFPIANTSLHVLDRDGRLAPVGLAGELHIGGQGVVRGYWNRPELTAERFVTDPFDEGRMYRTGDAVRRRPDGALEFIGRLDHQVKVRGHRIELGEIEARLREHADVKEAVVIARDDGSGPELVAYVIPMRGAADETELRGHLRSRVPEYMMPRAFVSMSAFPMTPNRKIDRKALPAPRRSAEVVSIGTRPEGTAEETIAAIWCEVLELPGVGVDTNFADVGGHSLAMVRVLGKLKERVSANISLVDLFRYTTIRSLAKFLSAAAEPDMAMAATASRAASRRAAVAQRGRGHV